MKNKLNNQIRIDLKKEKKLRINNRNIKIQLKELKRRNFKKCKPLEYNQNIKQNQLNLKSLDFL